MSFALEHFCEPLMSNPSYFSKKMFGGLAIYYNDLMTLVLVEKPGDLEYRDKKYSFEIWNGAMICTSREHHKSLQTDWPALVSHPVLGKWLYLSMSCENFEQNFNEIIESIASDDARIGIVPGQKVN